MAWDQLEVAEVERLIVTARQGFEAVEQLACLLHREAAVQASKAVADALRGEATASELANAACAKVAGRLRKFRGSTAGELWNYLQTTLMNEITDRRRGLKRRFMHIGRRISMNGNVDGESACHAPTSEPSPSANLRNVEQHEAVLQAVDRLKPLSRQAVLLRKYYRWKFNDVARVLNCSPEAASKRVKRALKQLRRDLGGAHEQS